MPNLTAAQLTTLKTDIAANAATVLIDTYDEQGNLVQTATAINSITGAARTGHAAGRIADWYNLTASPDYYVWRDLPMETVLSLITYAAMTPADSVPTVTALGSNPSVAQQATYDNQMATLEVFKNRALVCQGKQFNLQNLTIGRTTAPMKKANYRSALQDCLTSIPAGASGALIAANWTGVRDAAKFLALRGEKVLATGAGAFATPSDLGYEGAFVGRDIELAWAA